MQRKQKISSVIDPWRPNANPLIAQLLRQKTRLSKFKELRLAFGFAAVGVLAGVLLNSNTDLWWGLIFIGLLFNLSMPFVVAITAVVSTRRVIHSERFDVLYLTPLYNTTMIRALMFTTFYRLRYLLMFALSSILFIIIATFFRQSSFSYNSWWLDVIVPTLYLLMFMLALWGMNFLATSIGVRIALLRRDTRLDVLVAPLIVLVCMVLPFVCAFLYFLITFESSSPSTLFDICWEIFLLTFFMLAPYILTGIVTRDTANRWRC